MVFSRPTRTEIIERILADLEARFPGADASLRRSYLRALGIVFGGAVHLAYGSLADLAVQAFLDTAEGEMLERRAGIWGITREAATKASGTVTVTGGATGQVQPATKLQRSDGVTYVTTNTIGILIGASGSVSVSIEAENGGADGNADTGTELTFTSPPSNVNSTATVESPGLSGGADEETDEELRTRALARIQAPPHGGNAQDYTGWTLGYLTTLEQSWLSEEGQGLPSGLTRAFSFPEWAGAGTVALGAAQDDKTTFPNMARNGDFSEDNLIENGDFAQDAIWTKGDGWSITGGKAVCDGSQTAASSIYQDLPYKILRSRYLAVKFTVSNYAAGTVKAKLGGTAGTARSANGTYTQVLEVGARPRGRIEIEADASFIGDIDDVEVSVWVKNTGWSITGGKAVCDGSQTSASTIYQAACDDLAGYKTIKNGRKYTVIFTVSDYSAGSITPKLGGTSGTARNADGTYEEVITAGGSVEGVISFEADSSFVGKIDSVEVLDKREGTAEVADMVIQPSQEILDQLQAALEVLRPVCADLSVKHLAILPIDFTISITPNTDAVKSDAEAELRSLFRRIAEPGGTIYLSQLDEAISNALGEENHIMTVPSSNITLGTYEIPVLGTITWS